MVDENIDGGKCQESIDCKLRDGKSVLIAHPVSLYVAVKRVESDFGVALSDVDHNSDSGDLGLSKCVINFGKGECGRG